MKVRRLINGEPSYGQGKQDFVQDIDAVAQVISTRLKLFTNEWWEDIKDGLPVWTNILGKGGNTNKDKTGMIITKRILDTKLEDLSLVTGMSSVTNTFDGVTRKYTYTGVAKTIYGNVLITNG